LRPHPRSTLFPYTTLFRSKEEAPSMTHPTSQEVLRKLPGWQKHSLALPRGRCCARLEKVCLRQPRITEVRSGTTVRSLPSQMLRSEEHTSELQSRFDLVCR